MPYIHKVYRKFIDSGGEPSSVGDLTYKLFQLCRRPHAPNNESYLANALYAACLKYIIRPGSEPRYHDYAEVLGALTATMAELAWRGLDNTEIRESIALTVSTFYEVEIAPYEAEKRRKNGDVC